MTQIHLGELLRRLPDWSEAACLDADPEIFFPDSRRPVDDEDVQKALALCADCPVQKRCLDFALVNNTDGIWGGTTEEQRKGMTPSSNAAPALVRRPIYAHRRDSA